MPPTRAEGSEHLFDCCSIVEVDLRVESVEEGTVYRCPRGR
jgi:hypothetical protein